MYGVVTQKTSSQEIKIREASLGHGSQGDSTETYSQVST